MTQLLSSAFEKASKLPRDLQDQLAQEMIEEMEGEAQWNSTLADSQGMLEKLAERAEAEYRAGKTKEMGFDEL